MAVVNQYKANYPIKNSYQTDTVFINATTMEKAVNMLNIQYGSEPTFITKIHDNVLTEITDETTVSINTYSYYIDDEEHEVPIPECKVYPTNISNVKRGNTVYFTAPTYTFDEYSELMGTWNLVKWIYNGEEFTDNPYLFTVPLDESITDIEIKAIYTKE